MKNLILILGFGFSCNVALAQSFSDFVTKVARQTGDRFESSERLSCPNGSIPNLPGFYQYSFSEQRYNPWEFGSVQTHAPFIWLGKDYDDKPILGLTAAVSVDWVYCDDDGDTFERRSFFAFRSIYAGQGDIAAPTLTRKFFVHNAQGQRTGFINPSTGDATYNRLRDFDPYATGQIDGPSDEPLLFENPTSLQIVFEPLAASDSFVTIFKDACGVDQDLRLRYTKSPCDLANGEFCNELPENL